MGKCIYCGNQAGIFSSSHKECEIEHQDRLEKVAAMKQSGRRQITSRAYAALNGTESLDDLPDTVSTLSEACGLSRAESNSILVGAWESAVNTFLEDGILVDEEERRLVVFMTKNSLDMSKHPQFDRLVKSAALRDVMNGKIPKQFTIPLQLPINLQSGETVIWCVANTAYFEDKTRRQYVGGSQGISVRIMSGIYYRIGAFKGQAIERTERVHIDDGWFIVTNKSIYFSGPRKSLRIPFSKIVSFEPFSDGIGLHRDAQTAKPQMFITGDGWFTYNLIINLAQLCH